MFSQNKLWSYYDKECDYEFSLKMNKVRQSKTDFCVRNFSIYFLIQGGILLEANESSYRIKGGDIMIIQPGTRICKQFLDEEITAIELNFNVGTQSGVLEKMIQDAVSLLKTQLTLMRVDHKQFIFLIKKIESFMNASQENKEMYSLQLFLDIVLSLSNKDTVNNYQNELNDELTLIEKTVQDVMAYIHYNFSKKITTDILSYEFGVSRPYLCRKFKELSGHTIGSYLTQIRMAYAQELLSQSGEKIISIAYLSGYESVSQFNKTFRKIHAMTPSQFRDNSKKVHSSV